MIQYTSGRTNVQPGTVFLVGAGPGAPDLITVRGQRALAAADVVFYDRLVHPALLTECRVEADLVDVGKLPGCHKVPQSLIIELVILMGLHAALPGVESGPVLRLARPAQAEPARP